MPTVQIGNYTRPGIYIQEFDNSAITQPVVTGIATLVIGFSKTGPFNRPVTLQSQDDLTTIYGQLDRQLEKKGSFFHRTISTMLNSSQVIAINLLETDPTLDQLQYQSLSTSTGYVNGTEKSDSYSEFFNTASFWYRDTQSFLNIVKSDVNANQRILNFTNMGSKAITVFAFKSTKTGYNIDMLSWYGSAANIPSYVYSTDYVSDYMIDVVVISGDWTNYSNLSVDSRWGKYFNATGLVKGQVLNFINDQNVTLLKYYQGVSLIPFFEDQNRANIFVETVINADTDATGLFCAFNEEALETDYPNGLIDIIGNNLINDPSITSIDFLSYNDNIIQTLTYPQVALDAPGNTLAIMGSASVDYRPGVGTVNRTAYYAEGYVDGLKSFAPTVASASITLAFGQIGLTNPSETQAYAVVGGNEFYFNPTASFTINPSSYLASTASVLTYSSTLTLSTNGNINKYDNTSNSTNLNVSATDVVLGYIKFGVQQVASTNSIISAVYTPVTVNTTGYVELAVGTDYTVSTSGSNITVTYNSTSNTPDTSQYEQYRRIKNFNSFVNYLTSVNENKMTLVSNYNTTEQKNSLSGVTVSNVVTSTILNKSYTLQTSFTASQITDIASGAILMYAVDNEFKLGSTSIVTKNTLATSTEGVMGLYSSIYTGFESGDFNTGDYLYDNLITQQYNVEFRNVVTGSYPGNYVIFNGSVNPAFLLPQQVIALNSVDNGVVTLNGTSSNTNLGITLSNYYVYTTVETVLDELIPNETVIFDASNKHYVKAWTDETTNVVNIDFTDITFTSPNPISNATTATAYIYSQISDYKETVEIYQILAPNIILVDATRYAEVGVGNYLQAYVDPNALGVPKHLTRILSKTQYAANTKYAQIKTDAQINVLNFGTTTNPDYQTYRFTTVDDYVDTYKGTAFTGFTVRQASMPDGTENTQNNILNLIGKGTNLFNAVTNKEALQFRYLVDSFGLGLVSASKQQLVDICGNRLDALGIINMPSIRSFRESSNPTFTNSDGSLNVGFIAEGGDPNSGPAFLYSFGDGIGASCVGYFTPYVTVNDNGRPTSVPPSAYVATSYMKKFILQRTNVTPWTIVAGVVNGLVSNIGDLEYNYLPTDISSLNQMGANPIITKKNRGFAIETENTAQTDIRSALSFIHVREVLIQLEGELTEMLKEFQWKFNTADVRAEIKLRADAICNKYVAQNGIYNFFNKCDSENNPPNIIDNQMGVLDTYVEPVKGLAIIVNNVTILRTGAIASGGFQTK